MENPFDVINQRLGTIEQLLLNLTDRPSNALAATQLSDELLNVTQAATLLDLAKHTVYGLVWERKIPHSKKGKRLYFSRNELVAWVEAGKQKTAGELDEVARQTVATRQQRRKSATEH